MNKKLNILFALVVAHSTCLAQKSKKVAYEFPAAMSEQVRAAFAEQCDKGLVLYQINCGGCHNTTVKGKPVIPDFTPEQIKGYEIRVTNEKHENSLPDERVTAEELGLISTFLMYKKKNTP